MVLTLTVWQKKRSGHPTRAGEGRLEDPSQESFDRAVAQLLGTVEPAALPFQIVAQVGNTSRGLQLGQGWSEDRVATELWDGYRLMARMNG